MVKYDKHERMSSNPCCLFLVLCALSEPAVAEILKAISMTRTRVQEPDRSNPSSQECKIEEACNRNPRNDTRGATPARLQLEYLVDFGFHGTLECAARTKIVE